ncbi:hypothetical protein [Algoriphagus marinus]|uniref:hypothetical protein n=1 Tax=Algoriphagus marinus TaxID=1925762 RepID=UPI000B2A0937|nr:hypothetical protein [Algoriphagus marinus]
MMKYSILLIFFLSGVTKGFSQDSMAPSASKKHVYTASASETIFSFGIVDAAPLNTSTIPRFTPFFNFGQQLHMDFSENFGIYTGIGIRNVGMINDLNDSVRVKQRTYNVGIPVAVKFGDMDGWQAALGFEAEFAVAYKQKVYVNGEKRKSSGWFDDRNNLFQPSVFAELKGKEGNYIRFKYYLSDFLTSDQQINVPGVDYTPTQSQLFYVSIGYVIKNRDIKTMK